MNPKTLLVTLLIVSTPALAATPPGATPVVDARGARRTPVVDVFEANKDAVVNISSTSVVEVTSPFDAFFDRPAQRYKQTSVGSGFVIHPAGYIVTNAHVVNKTSERKVIFNDKREFDAKIIAIDQEKDLAVLKIESDKPFQTVKLGRSSDIMIGETVIAIGNPLGYQNTVTAGVVSALDREVAVNADLSFKGLIQTDASINPGNSGGPLLNVLGELIGINSAIRGDAQNIGFAIPVDHLRTVLPDMLDVERRYRIVLGVHIDADTRVVDRVEPGSPAAAAGVQPGDVIDKVDGKPVTSGIDFAIAMVGRKPFDKVTIQYTRHGPGALGAVTVYNPTIELAARPKPDGGKLLADKLGVTAEPIAERTAAALGARGLSALVITRVEVGSPASDAGLKRGDIVVQLGKHVTGSLDDAGEILEKVQPTQPVSVVLLRVQANTIYRVTGEIKTR